MNTLQFEDFTTRDGLPNTRIILEGKKVSLHSIQPYKEAERILGRFNPGLRWVVVAGCGLGYVLETILNKTSFHIIVFEHSSEILEHAKSVRDVKDIYASERVHVFDNTDTLFDFMDKQAIKELSFYIHRPYLTLFPDIYQTLEGIFISYLSKKQINKATLKRFQYVWLRNLIKNSTYFFSLPGLSDLRHKFHHSPAIVVGAGPSLQDDLPILKKQQHKLCIIATDTAYPILCDQGIQSDFVVSVDPQNKNTQFLLYSSSKDTCLVLDATGSFLSFAKSGMRDLIFYDSIFPIYDNISSYWGSKGQLLSGGSVSTNAFDLARQLHCDPIILSGQDLAFTDSHTHSRGNILEEFLYYKIDRLESYEKYNSKMLVLSDRIQIDSNRSGKVTTDRKFLTFLEWFKKQIRDSEVQVYNTSKSGALIKGTTQKDLSTILTGLPGNIDKNISFKAVKNDPAGFQKYLDGLLKNIELLLPYAHKAYASSLYCQSHSGQDTRSQFNTMSGFDRKLLTSLQSKDKTAKFLELCMQSSIEKMAELSEIDTINDTLIQGWVELYGDALKGLRYIKRLLIKRKAISDRLSSH